MHVPSSLSGSHSLDATTPVSWRPNAHSRLINSDDRPVGGARSPWHSPSATDPELSLAAVRFADRRNELPRSTRRLSSCLEPRNTSSAPRGHGNSGVELSAPAFHENTIWCGLNMKRLAARNRNKVDLVRPWPPTLAGGPVSPVGAAGERRPCGPLRIGFSHKRPGPFAVYRWR